MVFPIDRLGEDAPPGPLRLLVRHWLDLYRAGNGHVPALREIDPLRIGPALAHAWIVDATTDGRFRFRLAGEMLAEWYGNSLRDRFLEDVINPTSLPDTAALARAVLEQPMAAYQQLTARIADRSEPVRCARVALPLAGNDGRIRHILGASSFETPMLFGRGSMSSRLDAERRYAIPALGESVLATTGTAA